MAGTKTTDTKSDAKARDEESDSFTRTENLHNPPVEVGGKEFDIRPEAAMEIKRQSGRATAVDGQGITRLVDTHEDNWVPSALEPDPDEVARLEATHEALEAAREERAELLGLRGGAKGGKVDPDKGNAAAREAAGLGEGENVDKSKEG